MRVNILADAMKTIINAERRGKRQVLLRPVSKPLIKFLRIMQKHGKVILIAGYIGEFEFIDDHRSGKIVIELLGRLNKCGIISPRFNVPISNLESWCSKILPSRQFGHLLLTTTYGTNFLTTGILTHEECRKRHTGGKILGFFY